MRGVHGQDGGGEAGHAGGLLGVGLGHQVARMRGEPAAVPPADCVSARAALPAAATGAPTRRWRRVRRGLPSMDRPRAWRRLLVAG